MKRLLSVVIAAMSLAPGLGGRAAAAAEGVWTFEAFPAERAGRELGVAIDPALLDRMQAATVRLTNTGCSGAVVSRQGLVMSAGHCILECLHAISTPQADRLAAGVSPTERRDEPRCPGMVAEVLVETVDVTDEALAAPAGRDRAAVLAAREQAACRAGGPFRCQAVNLHRGGRFSIYRYRRYDDVRVAFAPEFAIAFFGGDPDNFTFPRYNLDTAFLRLYEGGRPARTPRYLAWSTAAPAAGEAVFLPGNPGMTERLLAVSQLETLRDVAIPIGQLQRAELRGRLIEFGRASEENRRLVAEPLFRLENAFKVFRGRQIALTDAGFMQMKRAAEAELRARVAADPGLSEEVGDPWAELEAAQAAYRGAYPRYRQLEYEAATGSRLFSHARMLVRAAMEREKPEHARLPEYLDARLASMRGKVLDETPLEPALEQLYLEHWLLKTRELLTVDDPAVRRLLGDDSPQGVAQRLVRETKLGDPKVRRRLWDGGLRAIEASDDPLIAMVLASDADARAAKAEWDRKVRTPTDHAAEKIARARFAAYGEAVYPDATFTPRLSYGRVEGWTQAGRTTTPFTTFAGLYDRATGEEPYALPQRWIDARGRLDLGAVFNFTASTDVIGGASGAPIVNARGEVIGTAFDGNIHSLGGAYGYDAALNRTVGVASVAVTEALTTVYGRANLVSELTGR